MTYNVFGATLNLTHPKPHCPISSCRLLGLLFIDDIDWHLRRPSWKATFQSTLLLPLPQRHID